MHQKKIITAGVKLSEAKKVLIMIHGRGGSAEDILSLADNLNVTGFALVAPQATNYSWYPQSFLALPSSNEPWFSSALGLLKEIVDEAVSNGINKEHIYFIGFSQGACLALEFVTRNATQYGGVAAFTGGLVGDKIYLENYSGNFFKTPVFIGASNPDPHVPVERVNASAAILEKMNADVTKKIYENMGHTINTDEISQVNNILFNHLS